MNDNIKKSGKIIKKIAINFNYQLAINIIFMFVLYNLKDIKTIKIYSIISILFNIIAFVVFCTNLYDAGSLLAESDKNTQSEEDVKTL